MNVHFAVLMNVDNLEYNDEDITYSDFSNFTYISEDQTVFIKNNFDSSTLTGF